MPHPCPNSGTNLLKFVCSKIPISFRIRFPLIDLFHLERLSSLVQFLLRGFESTSEIQKAHLYSNLYILFQFIPSFSTSIESTNSFTNPGTQVTHLKTHLSFFSLVANGHVSSLFSTEWEKQVMIHCQPPVLFSKLKYLSLYEFSESLLGFSIAN